MELLKAILAAAGRATAFIAPRRHVGSTSGAKGMTLCCQCGDGISMVDVSGDGKTRLIDCSSPDARRLRRPVVAVLPRSQYLITSIQTPQVAAGEIPGMLRLETEASLPPEFGLQEISYLQMPPEAAGGRLRFEVYVARDESLKTLADSLDKAGLPLDLILPSAVAWRGVLASYGAGGMLVVELPGGEMETVVAQASDGCQVRTIERHGGRGHAQLPRGVVESIRSLLAHGAGGDRPRVMWCGPGRPDRDVAAVRFESVDDDNSDGAAALALAWRGIGRLSAADLRAASLSPRGHEEGRRKRDVKKRLVTAAAASVAGMLLIQASLWILNMRCRSAVADLDRRIASIRRQGETTESRLTQLSAVASASNRQDEFQQLLAALYEFTPPGVSYSEIAMDKDGIVRLRGQALSMGQPFMLPSALDGKGPLSRVVVKSAGLSTTGGGTIAEFKAELILKREPQRP